MKFIIEQIYTSSATLEKEFVSEKKLMEYMQTDAFVEEWNEKAEEELIDVSEFNIVKG